MALRPQNLLLRQLHSDALSDLTHVAQAVTLSPGEVFASNVGVPLPYAYFPERGVISVRHNHQSGAEIEIAAVGKEGGFGLFSLLGVPLHSMVAEVTIEVAAWRVPVSDVRRLAAECPDIRQTIMAFLASLFNEVVVSVACYRFHTHDQWLARWLLTMADKSARETLPVTHEMIARRIGSPRHAVSTTLGEMRAAGVISSERGAVSIVDRSALQARACACYAAAAVAVRGYALGGGSGAPQ